MVKMRIINIELGGVRGYSGRIAASWKQVNYIHTLMVNRGMGAEFNEHFIRMGKIVCNRITKASATKLIVALRDKTTEIQFSGFVTTTKNLPDPPIKKIYEPVAPKKDVRRISFNEQRALEQKYMDEF